MNAGFQWVVAALALGLPRAAVAQLPGESAYEIR